LAAPAVLSCRRALHCSEMGKEYLLICWFSTAHCPPCLPLLQL
jgi:hypothetical protein